MMKKVFSIVMTLIVLTVLSTTALAVNFSDLTTEHWAYEPIIEMANKGILAGYPDGTFLPNKSITRAEFAKILVLSLNLKDDTNKNNVFDDVDSSHWSYDYVRIASNYLSGYTNGSQIYFMPDEQAVREDMAIAIVMATNLQNKQYDMSTLDRFSDKDSISESFRKYVAIAVENNLMRGNADGTFNPKGKLTRAEVSQLMLNTTKELEKIAIADNNVNENINKELFSDIIYDDETATIDLGEKWNEYCYTWNVGNQVNEKTLLSNLKNKKSPFYYPSQRVLNYYYGEDDEYNLLGGAGSSRFSGRGAVMIAKKSDVNQNIVIDVFNPFYYVKYDRNSDDLLLDDASKYRLFKGKIEGDSYEVADSIDIMQAWINKRSEGMKFSEFVKSEYVVIALKSNPLSTRLIHIDNTNNDNLFEDVKYNEETATIDLGEKWNEYCYTWNVGNQVNEKTLISNLKNKKSPFYYPSQRVLNYYYGEDDEYNLLGGAGSSRFSGRGAVMIAKKSDVNQNIVIDVFNPFYYVKYDRNSDDLLLDDASKYRLFKGKIEGDRYEVADSIDIMQAWINKRSEGVKFSEFVKSEYVVIALKSNPLSTRLIHIDSK